MDSGFVVIYKENHFAEAVRSQAFASRELAVDYAFRLLSREEAEPLGIIGPSGEVVTQARLDEILTAQARKGRNTV